jgi:formylglycine-generating enzyme required for sulfatase activity
LNAKGLPEFVWLPVPGGEVTLEGDAGTFAVEPFYISQYPVTWKQYRRFLEVEEGYRNERWWRGLAGHEDLAGEQYRRQDNHPAENVSWYDAIAFCRWLSARLGYEVRLPTEWEWQQAATGGKRTYEYPWGADWQPEYANTYESGLSRTTAVGLYPRGASPVGALDMAGNVWEWCLNEYDKPRRTDLSGDAHRVVRGGSWDNVRDDARASYRFWSLPAARVLVSGARLVVPHRDLNR